MEANRKTDPTSLFTKAERGNQEEADPSHLNYMKLKKWLAHAGCPKADLDVGQTRWGRFGCCPGITPNNRTPVLRSQQAARWACQWLVIMTMTVQCHVHTLGSGSDRIFM